MAEMREEAMEEEAMVEKVERSPVLCAAEFKSAVMEFKRELMRLQVNLADLTEYQEHLLRINKIMCCWMENTHKLGDHLKQIPD